MTITKYGHCCLLIEVGDKRILTDPGTFSVGHTNLTNLDAILITHEHADHCHSESVVALVARNPEAVVITNASVAALLATVGVGATVITDGERMSLGTVSITAFQGKHVEIFEDFGMVENTGYMIADRFFYPGDAYTTISRPVEILALPVSGPWCKISDALHYALAVAPKTVIPVHDGLLHERGVKVVYRIVECIFKQKNISFRVLQDTVGERFA